MEILLSKQELLDLGQNVHGVKIVCREGRCWITQTGDDRDHILRNGENFEVRINGHLIITATETCRIMLTGSRAGGRVNQPYRALISSLKSGQENFFSKNLS